MYQKDGDRDGDRERMKLFTSLSRTSRVMIMWVIVLCLAFLLVGLAVIYALYPFEGGLPYFLGILAGGAHSIIKIVLIEKSLSRILDAQKEGAESIGRLGFFGRYILTGVVFAAALLSRGAIGVFGTVVGVLSLQIAAFITGNLLKNKNIN
jgi:hypothetical protein